MNLPQWTEQDDARLKTHLERAEGKVTWAELSRNAFPDGRFNKVECSERWKIISKPKPSRGPWTKEEDARLERLVAIHSSEKWVVIMNEMVSRTGKQCRERWHNHLDPSINKGDWTAAEDETIHRLYSKIGSRWAEISKHLPGRPDNAIKNYWNASLVRQKRRRGGSISSLTSALDISGGESSATMTRSSSSNSLSKSRFAPYDRSTPMSKSRSDSISSCISPYEADPFSFGSAANSPPAFSSPYSSPGMSRSHSYNLSSSTSSQYQGLPPLHLTHSGSKDMADVGSYYAPHPSRDTPPATPDRSPFPHQQSPIPFHLPAEYPFYIATLSPPSSASLTFREHFSHSIHQSYDEANAWHSAEPSNRPFAGYDASEPFADLQINDPPPSNFDAYAVHDETSSDIFHDVQQNQEYPPQNFEHNPQLSRPPHHGHSYSFDSAAVLQQHNQYQHPMRHSYSASSHSFPAGNSQPSPFQHFALSSDSRPFIHPHHQLDGLSPDGSHSFTTSQQDQARLSPVPDEWNDADSEDEQHHPALDLHSIAVCADSPYAEAELYQSPSYEQIAAATDDNVYAIGDLLSRGNVKPATQRHESQISASSFHSSESPVLPPTSPVSIHAQPASRVPSPHTFTFPRTNTPLPVPAEDIKPTLESVAEPSAVVSVPRHVNFTTSLRRLNLSGLAAPINLDGTANVSRPTLDRATTGHTSPTLIPVPLRRNKTSDRLWIRTDGSVLEKAAPSVFSPRSAKSYGSRGSASPSWIVKHPTSDLMGVDSNGRACLPGL